MTNAMLLWNILLTAAMALCAVMLLRHRKYLIDMGRREERVRDEMRNLAHLLMDTGLNRRVAELRERWSAEAPMNDPDLQAKCLEFLREIESSHKGRG